MHIQSFIQSFNILKSFPRQKNGKAPKHVVEEIIHRSSSWLYFDGTTQGNLLVCGVGGIVFYF
jgi:hypothetical protein